MYTRTDIVDCGVPLPTCSNCISVNYSFTLEGSAMTFGCKEGFILNNLFIATCLPDGSWVPDSISPNCNIAVSGELQKYYALLVNFSAANIFWQQILRFVKKILAKILALWE